MRVILTHFPNDAWSNGRPGTSWEIKSKGQLLAHSGHTYRHRHHALAALERVTGAEVGYESVGTGRVKRPIVLQYNDGAVVPIEVVHL